MEPSCLAVFKDELGKMLPHDDDAARLARNVYHFPEFFTAFGIEPPRLDGHALLWGHCHHRATGGIEPEQQLLQQMGVAVENLEGGCCGLAGSWGFESGKFGISMDCGEQALLPAVRQADPGTLIVADGFSCKTQIADSGAGRHALHVAQVMKMARDGSSGPGQAPRPGPARRAARVAAAALPALAALGTTAVVVARRSSLLGRTGRIIGPRH
jgi:Fe-S oxidoreductase